MKISGYTVCPSVCTVTGRADPVGFHVDLGIPPKENLKAY